MGVQQGFLGVQDGQCGAQIERFGTDDDRSGAPDKPIVAVLGHAFALIVPGRSGRLDLAALGTPGR